ncbi:peptidase [Phycicoccus endophyticus]|uniref:peptidase n=1 Tax=Phycicoccus endophyticus TaxID=1690220 RepID=UPI00166F152E|nr:peptidase [Phycicoccus endophyticus]GGL27204.1 hypothetical protein GCM10012283_06790 [Phycicoccus endophyticus]
MSPIPPRGRVLPRLATVLTAGLALLVASAPAGAAADVSPDVAAQDAAAFVARTLTEYGHHYVYPDTDGTLSTDGYLDGGNTLDAVLALDGAHTAGDEADRAMAFLESHLGDYVGAGPDTTYAGSTAKALLTVVAHGGDPRSVGGSDLVARLEATEGAVDPGRFSDLPSTGCGQKQCDYSNTIGQSLALLALERAGRPVDDPARAFLLDQQCPDGGFRATPGGRRCASDPDATAFAAQALLALGATDAAQDALDHLEDAQGADGGLSAADGDPNANTTAVAVQAFTAGGRTSPADAGRAFLLGLRYGCSAPEALVGAVAHSAAERSSTEPADSDLRATPQATLALAGGSLLSVSAQDASRAAPASSCTAAASASPAAQADEDGADGSGSSALPVWVAVGVSLALLVVLGGWLARRRSGER